MFFSVYNVEFFLEINMFVQSNQIVLISCEVAINLYYSIFDLIIHAVLGFPEINMSIQHYILVSFRSDLN